MSNTKLIIWIFALLLFSANLKAQKNQINSLKDELKDAENTKIHISLLVQIGELYLYDLPDSSLKYSDEALIISEKTNYLEGTAKALYLAGKAYSEKREYLTALNKFKSSEQIFKKLNNEAGLGNCYTEESYAFARTGKSDSCTFYLEKSIEFFKSSDNIIQLARIERIKGLNYWHLGKYGDALISIDEAIEWYKELNDSLNLSEALNTKGAIYWGLTSHDNALKYFFEALYIIEALDKKSKQTITVYNNIGLVYSERGYNEKAITYFRKAEKMIPESDNKLGITYTYLNLGKYHYYQGQINTALELLEKSKHGYAELNDINGVCLCKLEIAQCYNYNKNFELAKTTFIDALNDAEKTKNNHRIALSYYYLAKNEFDQNNIQQSLSYSLKSLELANAGPYKDVQYLIYDKLSRIYENLRQTTLSLEMLKKAVALKDIIYQEKIAAQYEIMELTRENEKKDFENTQLKSENRLNKKTIRYQAFTVIMIILLLGAISIYSYRLSKKKKDLQKANQAKDKIFSIVSHDLRGPVGNLNNIIDLMVTEDVEEDYRDLLNMFKPVITSSYNMLENLLVWARSNLGKLEFSGENIPLHFTIKETILPFINIAEKKSISIKHSYKKEIIVFSDSILLQTIIRNLLNNAIKFTNELGTIKILIEESKKQIVISVKDNGVGISREKQKVIFAGNTHTLGTNKEIGSGLGLLLSKELAEKNGGSLWLESTEGKGSTFSFSVPKAPNA